MPNTRLESAGLQPQQRFKMLIAIMAGVLACGSGFAQTNWGRAVMYDSKTYKFLEPKIVQSNDLATTGGAVSNAQYAAIAGTASNLVGLVAADTNRWNAGSMAGTNSQQRVSVLETNTASPGQLAASFTNNLGLLTYQNAGGSPLFTWGNYNAGAVRMNGGSLNLGNSFGNGVFMAGNLATADVSYAFANVYALRILDYSYCDLGNTYGCLAGVEMNNGGRLDMHGSQGALVLGEINYGIVTNHSSGSIGLVQFSSLKRQVITGNASLAAGAVTLSNNQCAVFGDNGVSRGDGSVMAMGGFFTASNIVPIVSNAYDLGTAALPFRDLYLDTNSIYMGGQKVLSYNPANTSLVANVPIASTSGAVSVTVTGTPTNRQVIAWNADSSQWNPTNQSGGGSSTPGKWTVVVSTTNINVLVSDVAKTFVMQPTANLTNYLPSVAFSDIGTWYTFVKNGTNRLTIKAADADIIADSSAGARLYNSATNEYYATVTLQLANGTNWVITGAHGTWTSTTD